jgi:hypothetical protein
MAEDNVIPRDVSWRQYLPWTQIFRGFQITLDLNKLLLAAAGIIVMAIGWWLLSQIFAVNESRVPPQWPGNYPTLVTDAEVAEGQNRDDVAWAKFRRDRQHWNLMNEAVGLDRDDLPRYEVEDIAETRREFELISPQTPSPKTAADVMRRIDDLDKSGDLKGTKAIPESLKSRLRARYSIVGQPKPAGRLTISPWSEDRGPNPYLLVTGQAGIPWEAGYFWEWFSRDQVPVMIEPLVKFVRPVVYFLSPRNDFLSRVYFLLVTLWTLLTWSLFGGAITRIAAVQIARNESVGIVDALRFTAKRFFSYVTAPLFPLAFVFVMLVGLSIFGLLHMIPVVGDVVIDGIFWPVALLAGLGMAVALVGLVSWPLMAATVSTEGSDSWEAVSRAYSYIINRPWQCLWYTLVAVAYGGVIVFFVGFMSSLAVYMAKWGVSQTPFIQAANRDPSYLFVYAPTSFGWRELLLEGAKAPDGREVVASRSTQSAVPGGVGGVSRHNRIDPDAYEAYLGTLRWWNKVGAGLVAFWLGLMFLFVLGFGYAYFWSASTIIYLLLRRNMDAAEMDEVYFEEDEYEGFRMPAAPTAPAATASPAVSSRPSLPVVSAPPPPAAPAPVPPPAPAPVASATPAAAPVTETKPKGLAEPDRKTPDVVVTSPPASPRTDGEKGGEGKPPLV